ncbi:hypothetical protein [Burkholderia multivorans]|uniref:hypothetical protein n=1 Tax=Burkholderia multivorans TaxID=87883 RepID=UPI00207CBF84|nr:hypothetical protein [Burkholderia multivorans]
MNFQLFSRVIAMTNYFSFGILTFIVPLALVALYFFSLALRHAVAWLHRDAPPRERVIPMAAILAAIGVICGSALQPMFERASDCRAAGQAPVPCVLFATPNKTL